jgi:hypothetical protein
VNNSLRFLPFCMAGSWALTMSKNRLALIRF